MKAFKIKARRDGRLLRPLAVHRATLDHDVVVHYQVGGIGVTHVYREIQIGSLVVYVAAHVHVVVRMVAIEGKKVHIVHVEVVQLVTFPYHMVLVLEVEVLGLEMTIHIATVVVTMVV